MKTQKKIYYHHTDCAGVVYYARYLDILEEARTEYLSACGVEIAQLLKHKRFFVVARQEADYKRALYYGDVADVDTVVVKAKGARVVFEHKLSNQRAELCCLAKTTLVYVDDTLRPRPLEEEMITRLSAKG